MKKLFASAMIFLIIFSSFAVLAPKGRAVGSQNVIFQDNFEDYTINTFPSSGGWQLVYNGAGNGYQVITDSYYASPNKSLQLMGSYGWSVVTKKDFSFSSNLIGYEVSVMSSDSAGGAYFGFLNQQIAPWGRSYATVSFDDGYIGGGGQQFQPFTPYVWYKIRLVLDKISRNYDVWIDDVLVGENLTEANDPSEILSFQLSVGWKSIRHYFDDVKVFSVTSGLEASISPSNATTSIGGTVTYGVNVGNHQDAPDNFTLSIAGLDPSWYSLSRNPVYLAPWEIADVCLEVAIPENLSAVGTYQFSVMVAGFLVNKILNATLFVLQNPIISKLEPDDDTTISSTSTLFSWCTSSHASSEVYIKPIGDPTFSQIVGEPGTTHFVCVYNLSRNTDYSWYVHSSTTYGEASSNLATLHVSNGISFAQSVYTFNVERDYAQLASVSVIDTDTKSHDLLLQAINPYDDLIVGFVGAGSTDENLTIASGETMSVAFNIFAQDAVQQNYTFTIKLTNLGPEQITDYALVNVHVRQPNINLTLVEESTDPVTLSKTITATNNGDPITDLYIDTSDELAGKVSFEPTVSHAYLSTGGSLTFQAVPVLTVDFAGFQGLVLATSAGHIIASLPVNFTLPPGKSVYSVTIPRVSIEFSNYYDTDDSPNTNPLPGQPVESYLVNGTEIFAIQIVVDVYQNGTPASGANVSLTLWNSTGGVASLEYSMTDVFGKALFNVVGPTGSYSYQAELAEYALETETRSFSVSTSNLYEIRPNDISWLDVSDGRSTYNLTEGLSTVTLTKAPFTFRATTATTGVNATFVLVLRWDLDEFKKVYLLGDAQNDTLTFQTSGIPSGNFTAIMIYYSPDTGVSVSRPINITNTDSTAMYIQGNYTYYTPYPFNSTSFIRLITERSVSGRDPAVSFDLINIEPADPTNSFYQLEYAIVSNETIQKDFQFYVNTTEGELYNTTFHLNLEPATILEVNFTIPVKLPNGTMQREFDATLSTDTASLTTLTTPQLSCIYDSRIWVGSQLGFMDVVIGSVCPLYGLYKLYQTPAGKEVINCGAFATVGLVTGVLGEVGGIVSRGVFGINDYFSFVTEADNIDKAIILGKYLVAGAVGIALVLSAAPTATLLGATGAVLIVGRLAQCEYDTLKVVAGEPTKESTGVGVCKVSETSASYCTNRPEVSSPLIVDPPSADVVQAAAIVKFSLPWPKYTYRPHNVHLYINGIEIGNLTNTIPNGFYVFPFNSSILNYAIIGPSQNMIAMKMDNLNGGHYVVTSNWEIVLQLRRLSLSVVASNQTEAERLVEQLSGAIGSYPDFNVAPDLTFSNPQPKEGQSITITVNVLNLGSALMSCVPVDLYVDSMKVNSAIISFLPAFANQTVEFSWTATRGTHNMAIVVNGAQEIPESDYSNNQAQASLNVLADDVAIANVAYAKNVAGQGFSFNVSVTAANRGDFTETFNVTVYANATIIGSQNVTLSAGNSIPVTFTWDTTGFAKGNYTIWAYAWPIPSETDMTDNNRTAGTVTVTIAGDVSGEGSCDMQDISILIDNFMTTPPNWNPNCDVNNDLSIDMADISIAIDHFMQT